jgi:hypothetical protein
MQARRKDQPGPSDRSLALLADALLVAVAYDAVLRPWMRNWGSTASERAMRLAGDDVPADVRAHYTKGLTIEADPEDVWPWLVQIGDRRAGFYSYDWIERLLFPGLVHYAEKTHSAQRIHPELQDLRVGDRINTGSIGKLSVGADVTVLEPERALVVGTWAFILQPMRGGRTRLLVRDRDAGWLKLLVPRRFALARLGLGLVDYLVGDPLHFIMERRMMLGLKQRAECSHRLETLLSA